MTGRKEHEIKAANGRALAKGNYVFVAFSGEPRLHETRSALRNNDLVVSGDVIAVRVRDERERLSFPWIEPKIFVRQINAALVTDLNHERKITRKTALAKPAFGGSRLH